MSAIEFRERMNQQLIWEIRSVSPPPSVHARVEARTAATEIGVQTTTAPSTR
jgi:hypothetical protein